MLRGLGGEVRQRIVAAIARVGLLAMAKTPIEALSGGQFQRMLFARVMVQRAPLVMLDEPFTGIDEATCRELMALILEMHQQGQTILAVLHDNQRVADYFPETMLLTPQRARWAVRLMCCPPFTPRGWHDLAHLHSALYRVWLYAPRAGGVPGALPEHDHARRLLTFTPHEPDGRCALACDFARRGGGLPA